MFRRKKLLIIQQRLQNRTTFLYQQFHQANRIGLHSKQIIDCPTTTQAITAPLLNLFAFWFYWPGGVDDKRNWYLIVDSIFDIFSTSSVKKLELCFDGEIFNSCEFLTFFYTLFTVMTVTHFFFFTINNLFLIMHFQSDNVIFYECDKALRACRWHMLLAWKEFYTTMKPKLLQPYL